MLNLQAIHHIAIIGADYERSKRFYVDILGLTVLNEAYRTERQSHKLDLALNGRYIIELFSFPDPPRRPSRPEALGLRHLAFTVPDLDVAIAHLAARGVMTEAIRTDQHTGKRFTFFADPDGLPLELYQA